MLDWNCTKKNKEEGLKGISEEEQEGWIISLILSKGAVSTFIKQVMELVGMTPKLQWDVAHFDVKLELRSLLHCRTLKAFALWAWKPHSGDTTMRTDVETIIP